MFDGDSTDGSDDGDGGGRRWLAAIPLAMVVALVALVALYLLGVFGAPSVGVADAGEWGTVTEERTEVVTTVWVRNPNPIGTAFGPGLTAEYDIAFNGVTVAVGDESGLAVPPGNTTMRFRTALRNKRIPEWWVAYVRANETLRVAADATVRADVGPSPAVSRTFERDRTMLRESRPVVDAVSGAVDRTRGRYTRTVDFGERAPRLAGGLGLDGESLTVGYEVERGWASWGTVTENRTTMLVHLRVRNPGDVPVPAAPAAVRASVDANGVRLFETDAEALSVRELGADEVLRPGEERTLTVAATMDNDNVDEWFTRHVRNGERSTVTARVRLLVDHPLTNATLRLPADGPATRACSVRTALLVDNRTAGATCGADGPAGVRDRVRSTAHPAPSPSLPSDGNPGRQYSSATEARKATVEMSTE
ncbi:LEA type 2 family protein [Halosimplex pelagicum]|uniref:LEA type 2 family protein n=1 Tax=Halosimplex pelagicum TaxID=869886 RepID=A0A7D5TBQ7_9EURY|nr:LEA type 2 family protein [Halosimplex pelagicum]QLH81495.1 LEA type 2 family protein [Halosimplex pelagicum]